MEIASTPGALGEIASFGLAPDWMDGVDIESGGSSGDELAKIAWRQTVRIIAEHDTRASDIDRNPNLSFEGKRGAKARAVADAQLELAKVATKREKLQSELDTATALYKPAERNSTVSAAIWAALPTDPIKLGNTYRDALEHGDFVTANAIETVPRALSDGLTKLGPEKVAELKDERMAAEDPEAHGAITKAARRLDAVDRVHRIAENDLAERARHLPDPSKSDATIGPDGLLTMTPSQVEEARGA